MKILLTVTATFLSLGSVAAQAGSIQINVQSKCEKRSASQIYDRVTNYENYKNLDDRLEQTIKLPVGSVRKHMVNMIQSTSRGNRENAKIVVQLHPIYLDASELKLYPVFALQCGVKKMQGDSFEHKCDLIPSDKNVGVGAASSFLSVVENGCGAGVSKLAYDIKVTTIDKDVEAIMQKSAVGMASFIPQALVNGFIKNMDQDAFFRSYFDGFYKELF